MKILHHKASAVAASLLLLTTLVSCISDEYDTMPAVASEEIHAELHIAMPPYKDITRAALSGTEEITADGIQIFCFDAGGLFLGTGRNAKVTATDNTTGTVTATLHNKTAIFHLLANANASVDPTWIGKSEQEVMKQLVSTQNNQKVVYWGRHAESSSEALKTYFNGGNTLYLLRDRAKVTVSKTDTNIQSVSVAIANGNVKGATVPIDGTQFPDINTADDWSSKLDFLTIPSGTTGTIEPNADADFKAEAFAFEHENKPSNPIKAILRVVYTDNAVRYHQILLQDDKFNCYTILRNHEYRINVKKLNHSNGYSNIADAINGVPSNNAFVIVNDIVPSVSDGTYTLTIDDGTSIVLNKGAGTSQEIAFTYTGDSDMTASDFTIGWTSNAGLASGDPTLNYDKNMGKGTVSYSLNDITSELKTATLHIQDTKHGLSRNVRIYSINEFNMNVANSITLGKSNGSTTTLTVTIPENYPDDLMPVTVRIASNDINPVDADVEVGSTADISGGENWNCWFLYKAYSKGVNTITIRNVRDRNAGDEGALYIKADYFGDVKKVNITFQ